MRHGSVIGILILFCVSLVQVPICLDWSVVEDDVLPSDIDFDSDLPPGFNETAVIETAESLMMSQFQENLGQVSNPDVLFYGNIPGGMIGFGVSKILIWLEDTPHSIEMTFIGSEMVTPVKSGITSYKSNYFLGNRGTYTDVQSFQEIVYNGLWPGIDLVYKATSEGAKYEYRVSKDSDYEDIVVEVHGHDYLRCKTSSLSVSVFNKTFYDTNLIAYQNHESISANFILVTENRYKFSLTGCNPNLPVIIDPLLYSTYVGGSVNDEWGYDYSKETVAVDDEGNVYVAGATNSADFPMVNAYNDTIQNTGGVSDSFIFKLNSTGNGLVYSTFISAENRDVILGIDIDSSGNVYVTGFTDSENFPTLNAFDSTKEYGWDSFLLKLNATGNGLVYSTYVGGGGHDEAWDIVVNDNDEAIVIGYTNAPTFPRVNAYDNSHNGGDDIFVFRMNSTGNGLIFSTFIGGSGDDIGRSVAIDVDSNCYITGYTSSTDMPIVNGVDDSPNGGNDCFIAKLSANGSSLYFSTYYGGSGGCVGLAIDVDDQNQTYVTGYTQSSDFPLVNAVDSTFAETETFIVKLNETGNGVIYSTYFGGSIYERGWEIKADSYGNAYVLGYTTSSDMMMVNALDDSLDGTVDCYAMKISSDGSIILYSTFFGGTSPEYGRGMDIDENGTLYGVGFTYSSDLPTLSAYDSTANGGTDVFAFKLGDRSDEDNDGLLNYYEIMYGTDTNSSDSDSDFISDYDEIYLYLTNPVSNDSDSDSLDDYTEIFITGTDPNNADSDSDNLNDYDELNVWLTDPNNNDTDSDFLRDDLEVLTYFTNPLVNDTDSDLMLDGWETQFSLNPLVDDSLGDPDSDLLVNIDEFYWNTNPQNPDSDSDTYTDGYEVHTLGSDPLDPQLPDNPIPDVTSSYFGGTNNERGMGIDVDSAGNVYIVGYTDSASFPIVNGLNSSLNGGQDAFVIKLNRELNTILWSTFIGGNDDDIARYIDIGFDGHLYITGSTDSIDWPMLNSYGSQYGDGYSDIFVLKLEKDGNQIIYSSVLGASSWDIPGGIVTDDFGYAYVTGWCWSGFPGVNSFDTSTDSAYTALVFKLSRNGSTLIWSGFLGGNDDDNGFAIALDDEGYVYVGGRTQSTDFPTVSAYDTTFNGNDDAFLAKISNDGQTLVYSTLFGGSDHDRIVSIVPNSDSTVSALGYTLSGNLPTKNAYDSTFNGNYDNFIVGFNESGTNTTFCTYLGGSSHDYAYDMEIDSSGYYYVTGYTYSSNLPNQLAYQESIGGNTDAYIIKMNQTDVIFGTYVGGTGYDWGTDLTLDELNHIYLTGYTESSDFPIVNGYDSSFAGGQDAHFFSMNSLDDSDADGISDSDEFAIGTQPFNNDTDSDLIPDGWEHLYGLNPLSDDSSFDYDNDALTNLDEYHLRTNPFSNDSDGDTMPDDYEVAYGLNPIANDGGDDLDKDKLLNLEEFNYGTRPNNSDTDSDLMPDGWEVFNELNALLDDANGDLDSDTLLNLAEYYNGTLPNNNDTDSDSLSDGLEVLVYGTNPLSNDTDSDTMPDAWEIAYELNPLIDDSAADYDLDILTNLEEFIQGTLPNNNDTDSDAMPDGWEVQEGLNATLDDSSEDPDFDMLANYEEFLAGTAPKNNDTDYDSIIDGLELLTYGTNPLSNDTDSDLMLDYYEISYGLDPLSDDSLGDLDLDGVPNIFEMGNGTLPNNNDTDSDLMNDYWEILYDLDPLNASDAGFDPDFDLLTNLEELTYGTSPISNDTDSDFMRDDWEIYNGLNATDSSDASMDFDLDMLTNLEEYVYNTDPNNYDTDGDTFSDGIEINHFGSDPLDPNSPTYETEPWFGSMTSYGNDEIGYGIAVDHLGFVYVTGVTFSTDFATIDSLFDANAGQADCFVLKFDSNNGDLIYTTYFGGLSFDQGQDIEVNTNGEIHIVGTTSSIDFPTMNPYDDTLGGGRDCFLLRLNSAGNSIIYSTFFGGLSYDECSDMYLNASGYVYFTGWTNSSDMPAVNGVQSSLSGGHDMIIGIISPIGDIVYSSFYGGPDGDNGLGITVDSHGNIIIVGYAGLGWPTLNALNATSNGSGDFGICKVTSSGNEVLWATYLGGTGLDVAMSVATDSYDNLCIAGYSSSNDFPTLNGYDDSINGGTDAVVLRINELGTELYFSTYIGGSSDDFASELAVDTYDYVYVTGVTSSPDFPMVRAYNDTYGGVSDCFFSKLNPTGDNLTYSTYLGGSGEEQVFDITLDDLGNSFISGYSDSTNFASVIILPSTWWLSGWSYRKAHQIDAGLGTGQGYQMRIVVNYGSGSDSGENVFCDSQCKSDFSDIRFTDDDTTTKLSYWMEEMVLGSYAIFWVKINDDLDTSQTIYMYYGNPSATSESNGEATFRFFDDFEGTSLDNSKWIVDTIGSQCTYEVVNGELHVDMQSTSSYANNGFIFNARENFIEDDFQLHVEGRWASLDYSRGGANILVPLLLDTANQTTGLTVNLRGSYYLVTRTLLDGTSTETIVSDHTSGSSTFDYMVLNSNQFNMQMSGTYSRSYTGTVSGFTQPFRLAIYSTIQYWTNSVYADVYYDVVYMKKNADIAPTHSTWGVEEENIGIVQGLEAFAIAQHNPDDFDMDGIPDDVEFTLGTVWWLNDTDSDSILDGWEIWNGLNATDATDALEDPDFDGITNLYEYRNGTSPFSNDTDNDLLPDSWEIQWGTNPLFDDAGADPDADTLTNYEEFILGTDPLSADTDSDSIPDWWEVANGLDPLLNDSLDDPDSDLLTNLDEYLHNTMPFNNDTDSDSMPDGWEISNGLNATLDDANIDSDFDELLNWEEYILGTQPNNYDTDSDLMPDGWEVSFGLDPLIDDAINDPDLDTLSNLDEFYYGTSPISNDTDSDFMRDDWEIFYGLNATDSSDAIEDSDLDTLTNLDEFNYGTSPISNDTDSDFMRDDWEIFYGLNATDASDATEDPDIDTLTNLEEFNYGTSPISNDTDSDLMPDWWEIQFDLNPLNATDAGDDPDGDGFTNLEEYQNGTNPITDDDDFDGMSDAWEILHGLDPFWPGDAVLDPDLDGLTNLYEYLNGTLPHNNDTDSDTLLDGWEVDNGLNPLSNDTDSDTMLDDWEVAYGLNPLYDDSSEDLDGDGLSNLFEYNYPLNPNNSDTDSDLMPDGWEVTHSLLPDFDDAGLDPDDDELFNLDEYLANCDPHDWDTDDDLMPDGWEVSYGLEGFTPNADEDADGDTLTNLEEYLYGTSPISSDTDSDIMPDNYEIANGLNATLDDAYDDPDNDTLVNLDEYFIGTLPLNNDTDSDLMPDGWEYNYSLDPLDPSDASEDPDGDYRTNLMEYQMGSDPHVFDISPDSDFDGMPDSWEILYGFDPFWDGDAFLDFDSDGLENLYEYLNGTLPNNNDTDSDLMHDGWEVANSLDPLVNDATGDPDLDTVTNYQEYVYGTNPNNNDTDSDLMPDGWEILYGLDPLTDTASDDDDFDLLTNLMEYNAGTNPIASDTDSDLLDDYEEIYIYSTDPLSPDSDSDYLTDWQEISIYFSNPLDPESPGNEIEPLTSSYLGGTGTDHLTAITVDALGFVYIAGYTESSNFPIVGGYDQTRNGFSDVIVVKFDPECQEIIYSTFIGGYDIDYADGIVVDEYGCAYIACSTTSPDFPITVLITPAAGLDCIVVKLNANGNELEYSARFGGSSDERPYDIAIDNEGYVYAAGYTRSTTFPHVNSINESIIGGRDVFVVKLNETGTGFVYASTIGGSSTEYCYALEVDSLGAAWVTGYTYSTDYPITDIVDSSPHSDEDCFVTKFSPEGNECEFSTVIGGSDMDMALSVALDTAGDCYIGGFSYSSDFPVIAGQNEIDTTYGSCFITKISAQNRSIEYSMLFGGDNFEAIADLKADTYGNLYAVGYSQSTDFPVLNAFNDTYSGSRDAVLLRFGPNGHPQFSSYFGGSLSDSATSLVLSQDGGLYIIGDTSSYDFPVYDAFEEEHISSGPDGFVTRFPALIDRDSDTLDDFIELELGTNPLLNDSDYDDMPDSFEVRYGLDPLSDDAELDPDSDSLTNLEEFIHGTNPLSDDTDSDSMPDGWEIAFGLNPCINDASLDGDHDILTNAQEYYYGTDPTLYDSDSDELSDGYEILYIGSNPLDEDTDSDSMPDAWEVRHRLNPLSNDADEDPDDDNLTNILEFTNGLDPQDWDTDSDQMPDGWEVQYYLEPLRNDADGDADYDGLTNLEEYRLGTNPRSRDTDGDGSSDYWEVQNGYDPLDKNDAPLLGLHLIGPMLIIGGFFALVIGIEVLSRFLRRKSRGV